MMRTLSIIHDQPIPPVDDDAGFGSLQTDRGCLPLVSLEVSARISGLLSESQVRQTFRNSLDEPLEATYIFPLPDRAAVTSFRMHVGDRVVEGHLKERGQARADYRKAIEDGHRAALAEEDRSGTFCLQVGNIPPKENASVELAVVGPLAVSGGEATFRFPLVVAPRYVAGIPLDGRSVGAGQASDTDEVPDASRVTPPVLLPGFPNSVGLSLEVELDPGSLDRTVEATHVASSLHSVIVEEGPKWQIRLQPGERLDRDFILRFPVASNAVRTSLVASSAKAAEPRTFALTLFPPAMPPGSHPPRDVVVVLDRSGSMRGWKMVAARRAAGRIVDSLLEDDRFAVLAFDSVVESPQHTQGKLTPATDRARWRAVEWLGGIGARGGTEMGEAVAEAMRLFATADGQRERILVFVTDGQVAGEDAVLGTIYGESPSGCVPRIHAIGIDRAVNAGFLQRLAGTGGGTCDLVESEDRLDAVMKQIQRQIAQAVVTNLKFEGVDGTLVDDSVAPARSPDLFADRPVTLFGQSRSACSELRLRVSGTDSAGQPWGCEIAATDGPAEIIRSLWGRARVRDLEDRYAAGGSKRPKALAKEIVEVSLATHVLSRFTAYVAVDTSEVVNRGGRQQQVVQPVELPDGWDVADGAFHQSAAMPFVSCSATPVVCERIPGLPRPGWLRESAQPETLEELVWEISEVLTVPIKDGVFARLRSPRKRLACLCELLRLLAAVLADKSDAVRRKIEELAAEGEARLMESKRGHKNALQADKVNEYFARVREAVANLEGRTTQQRKRFWT